MNLNWFDIQLAHWDRMLACSSAVLLAWDFTPPKSIRSLRIMVDEATRITAADYATLVTLQHWGAMSRKAWAQAMGVSTSTMRGRTNKAQRLGLINQTGIPGQHSTYRFELTPRGEAAIMAYENWAYEPKHQTVMMLSELDDMADAADFHTATLSR